MTQRIDQIFIGLVVALFSFSLAGCKDDSTTEIKEPSSEPAYQANDADDIIVVSAFGSVRSPYESIPYSKNVKIADLLDFDSHATLSPLNECYQETLHPFKDNMIIDCFSETMNDYDDLSEGDVLESLPYRSRKAGMYFRKQGFQPMLDMPQADQESSNAYYEKSEADKNLPLPVFNDFTRLMEPEGCLLQAQIFVAGESSPLWDNVPKKTIYVKDSEKGNSSAIWRSEMRYLVALVPSAECEN